MKSTNELLKEIVLNHTTTIDTAVFECLCDIRLLLANLNYGQGRGSKIIINQSKDLINKELATEQTVVYEQTEKDEQ